MNKDDIIDGFVKGMKGDLDEIRARLEGRAAAAEPILEAAALLAAQVAVEKMAGEDTTLSEQALASTASSLGVVANIEAAAALRVALEKARDRAFSVVLGILA